LGTETPQPTPDSSDNDSAANTRQQSARAAKRTPTSNARFNNRQSEAKQSTQKQALNTCFEYGLQKHAAARSECGTFSRLQRGDDRSAAEPTGGRGNGAPGSAEKNEATE
jgi:hypothetical protein